LAPTAAHRRLDERIPSENLWRVKKIPGAELVIIPTAGRPPEQHRTTGSVQPGGARLPTQA